MTYSKPMRSIWQSLLWKEWHEHKWKLVALMTMISAAPVGFHLFTELEYVDQLQIAAASIIPFGILAGLFAGMSTAANEQQRGTMRFLQTLPISMTKPAVLKLGAAFLAISIPMVALLTIIYLCAPPTIDRIEFLLEKSVTGGLTVAEQTELAELQDESHYWQTPPSLFSRQQNRELSAWFAGTVASGCLFVGSLLLWMAACGVNRCDEIRAGAIGFLVIVLVWGAIAGAMNFAERNHIDWLEQSGAVLMATAAGAPGFLVNTSRQFDVTWLLRVLSATLGHGFLAYWFLTKFGRDAVRPARTLGNADRLASRTSWLASPCRSRLSAIVWKQFWETAPLALIAAVAVLVISAIGYWMQDRSSPMRNEFGMVLLSVGLSVGFLVTLVAGIGVFLEDMRPGVSTFWRSRPVRLPLWFGVKFLTGAMILVGVFGSLVLLAACLQWDEAKRMVSSSEFFPGLLFVLLLFLLVYTLSMSIYCSTGHAMWAAMGTVALVVVGSIILQVVIDEVYHSRSPEGLSHGVLVVAEIAALALAYFAVRRGGWAGHRR